MSNVSRHRKTPAWGPGLAGEEVLPVLHKLDNLCGGYLIRESGFWGGEYLLLFGFVKRQLRDIAKILQVESIQRKVVCNPCCSNQSIRDCQSMTQGILFKQGDKNL